MLSARRPLAATALVVGGYAVLLALWWIAARADAGPASPLLDPVQLLQTLWRDRGPLVENLAQTAQEAGWGLAVGAGLALLVSVACVRFAAVGDAIHRIALILYSLPLIAIAPVLVIVMGTGVGTKVIIAALAAFFPVLVNAVDGLGRVDRRALEMMEVIGAPYAATFLRVRVPYALPSIVASLTVAAPSAVIGATVAEWVGGERGLGVAILYAAQSYQIDVLWSSIAAVTVLSLISYAVFAFLGRRLFPWHASATDQAGR